MNSLEKYAEKQYPNILSKDEASALYRYTMDNFFDINQLLRNKRNTSDFDEDIALLTSAIDKFDYSYGKLTVFRFLFLPENEDLKRFIQDAKSGFFYDGAFSSCTLDEDNFLCFANLKMRIILDEEVSGAYIRYLSGHPTEQEFLLDKSVGFETINVFEKKDAPLILCRARNNKKY